MRLVVVFPLWLVALVLPVWAAARMAAALIRLALVIARWSLTLVSRAR